MKCLQRATIYLKQPQKHIPLMFTSNQCCSLHRKFCTTKIQEISVSVPEPDNNPTPKRRNKSKHPSMRQQFFNFLVESTQIQHTTQDTNEQNIASENENIDEDYNSEIINSLEPAINCPHNSRFGRVSIIGMPNAGKSSLLNRIINHPVSAISSKVNTTREQTIGCLTTNNIQIEFIDTPGILPLSLFHPQRDKKQHHLHYEAWESVYKSDIIIMIIDPTKKSQNKNILIAEQLNTVRKNIDKFILVINKCDLFWPHTKLHELAELINSKCEFDITLIISAKHRRRIDKVRGYLLSHIGSTVNQKSVDRYSRKWQFESHMKTNMSIEDEILECIRAKLYQRTHKEVPYNVELEMENVDQRDDKIFVHAIVNVKTRSHQNMLNGSAGQYIKRWASRDLTTRFGKEVIIKLKVSM